VVLMPASLVERLAAHAAPTPEILKPFQMLNRAFRRRCCRSRGG
jgi:hypothetical protein